MGAVAEENVLPTSVSTPTISEASPTASSPSASSTTFSTPSETGARPKTSSTVSVENNPAESGKEKNPFESLTKEGGRSPEQEEMRRKRLAVFEEQKKRLMNQK